MTEKNIGIEFREIPLPDIEYYPHMKNVGWAWYWVKRGLRLYLDDTGPNEHLRIKPVLSNLHEPSWKEKQTIKNAVWGEHSIAVEVYPRQADVIDNSPTYHLFLVDNAPNLKELYKYKDEF